jgi:hypothetical protein
MCILALTIARNRFTHSTRIRTMTTLVGGSEIRVNTTTTGSQGDPDIAALSDGRYIVTWTDTSGTGGDTSGAAVRAQIWNADGTPYGGEFLVNTRTASDQADASVSVLSGDRFIVAWRDHSQQSSYNAEIRAQLYNSDGTPSGVEFVVNTERAGYQGDPQILELSSGNFVVSWSSGGTGSHIFAQMFDASGAKIGSQITIDELAIGGSTPRLAALPNGGFAVGWSHEHDSGTWGTSARIFDGTGTAAGSEFIANTTVAGTQQLGGATGLSGGNFVLTWADYGHGEPTKIIAQVFDPSGAKVGGEITVNTGTGPAGTAAVTALADGGFVVTWKATEGGDANVVAQLFNPSGVKVGGEFLVNDTVSGYQGLPQASQLADGRLIFTWEDNDGTGSDGSGMGIVSRVFDAPVTVPTGGSEVRVNTVTASNQEDVDVAAFSDGRFIVTWSDASTTGGDTSGGSVRAQIFDADGTRSGSEFLVNTTTFAQQGDATVQVLSDDRFIITWRDSSSATYSRDIKAQIFNSNGTKSGSEFLVNTGRSGSQFDPHVVELSDGTIVIGWTGGGGSQVDFQMFSPSGVAVGSETKVDLTSYGGISPRLASLSDGGFIVAWSHSFDGGTTGVAAQVFDSAGISMGGEIAANTTVAGSQELRGAVGLEGGGFVLTWNDNSSLSYINTIAQVFDASGTKIGGEITVSVSPGANAEWSSVTALSGGGFVVAWQSNAAGDANINAQIFDGLGGRLGDLFVVNDATAGFQGYPQVAQLADGRVVFAWEDNGVGGDGSGNGVKARVFDIPAAPASGNQMLSAQLVEETIVFGESVTGSIAFEQAGEEELAFMSSGEDSLSYDAIAAQPLPDAPPPAPDPYWTI